MELSNEGALFIAQFEGFSAKPYVDPASGGEPITIGYGTTIYADGTKVTMKDKPIDKATALVHLKAHVSKHCNPVLKGIELNQHQYDALCSFIYNLGAGNFNISSLKRSVIAKANCDVIKTNFNSWVKAAGKVMKGLVRRRAAEGELYCSGKYA